MYVNESTQQGLQAKNILSNSKRLLMGYVRVSPASKMESFVKFVKNKEKNNITSGQCCLSWSIVPSESYMVPMIVAAGVKEIVGVVAKGSSVDTYTYPPKGIQGCTCRSMGELYAPSQ